jgi:hypothetical protein
MLWMASAMTPAHDTCDRGERIGKGSVATEEMMAPATEERELSRALAIMMGQRRMMARCKEKE